MNKLEKDERQGFVTLLTELYHETLLHRSQECHEAIMNIIDHLEDVHCENRNDAVKLGLEISAEVMECLAKEIRLMATREHANFAQPWKVH